LLSLTLVEPSCFHVLNELDPRYIDEIRAVAEAVSREVICGDYLRAMKAFIVYWGGVDSWDMLPDEKKTQFAQVAVHVAHHFWSLVEDNNTPLTAYAEIDVPTLILCGSHSPAPSRAITRLLANAIPVARHRTIPYADHMSPINRAAEVNTLILEHLLTTPRCPSLKHPVRPGIAAR
jgi:pimeloyl-ACP methyl ester carboxylesterase